MDLVKVYYCEKIGGFLLFNPDGSIIPCIRAVSVSDEWAGGKTGNRVTVTLTLQAEMVNEQPAEKVIGGDILARVQGSDLLLVLSKVQGKQK